MMKCAAIMLLLVAAAATTTKALTVSMSEKKDLVADSASQIQAILKEHHHQGLFVGQGNKVGGALARGFGTLGAGDNDPKVAACMTNNAEFVQSMSYLASGCEGGLDAFLGAIGDLANTTAASIAGARTACGSQCYKNLSSLVTNYGTQCFSDDTLGAFQLVVGLCAKSSTTGELCTISMRPLVEFTSCSDKKTSTDCGMSSRCSWNTAKSSCNSVYTDAAMQGVCTDDCAGKLIGLVDGEAALTFNLMRDLVCSKVGSRYCGGVVQDVDLSGFGAANPDVFCADETKKQCTARVLTIAGQGTRLAAEKSLKSCIDRANTQSTTDDVNSARAACVTTFAQTLNFMDVIMQAVRFTCLRTGPSSGRYCMSIIANFSSEVSATFVGCLDALPSTCTSTCGTEIATTLTGLGCCMPALISLKSAIDRDAAADIPEGINATGLTFAPPAPGFMAQFAACTAVAAINDTLKTMCLPTAPSFAPATTLAPGVTTTAAPPGSVPTPPPTAAAGLVAPAKTFPVSIPATAWESSAALKAKLERSLGDDIAAAINTIPANIQNRRLSRDSTRKVTVKVGKNRQSLSADASTFSFSVVGLSAAEMSATAAQYDQASKQGQLATPSTTAVVKKQCGSACGVSATSGSISSLTTITTSGAVAHHHGALLVAAVMCALATIVLL